MIDIMTGHDVDDCVVTDFDWKVKVDPDLIDCPWKGKCCYSQKFVFRPLSVTPDGTIGLLSVCPSHLWFF